MKDAVEHGGDYSACDLRFHRGLLRACHNRMLAQMGKALSALLRTSFEISNARPTARAEALPLHRAPRRSQRGSRAPPCAASARSAQPAARDAAAATRRALLDAL